MLIQKPIAAMFLDLDGTLVDSAADLTTALNISLQQLGYPNYPLEQTIQWIGNGLDQLLHRALTNDFNGQADAQLLHQAREGFFSAYHQVNGDNSVLFDGVLPALERFHQSGLHLACVTNKSRVFSLQLLERMKIHHFFTLVVAGDDVSHKKPAPDAILNAMRHYQVSADQCLMIGDSDNDVLAANNAGVDVLCVNYGYSQGVDLSEMNISGMIDSIDEIKLTG